ncbi:MAG: LapA family protein [Candidatus Puniceispirillaceae bacterium]
MTAIAKLFWGVLSIILFGYIAFFAIANPEDASVTLWPGDVACNAPIWLICLTAFFAGLLIATLFASLRISALRLRLFRLQKQQDSDQAKAQQQANMLATTAEDND